MPTTRFLSRIQLRGRSSLRLTSTDQYRRSIHLTFFQSFNFEFKSSSDIPKARMSWTTRWSDQSILSLTLLSFRFALFLYSLFVLRLIVAIPISLRTELICQWQSNDFVSSISQRLNFLGTRNRLNFDYINVWSGPVIWNINMIERHKNIKGMSLRERPLNRE